jgi:hypothetical protein
LKEIVSDGQGEARLIDNEGRILKWNGTTFESLGQISIPYGQYLNKIIFVDGEYYGIVNYSTGTILRYNPETDSTVVYNLINHICSAEALSKGVGNQVLAAFGVSAENETKLYRLQNEEWNEISMPVNESPFGSIVIYCDNQERLWFGYDSKLYEVTGNNFRLIQLPESLHAPGVNSYCYNNDRIKSLFGDEDGSIWIAKGSGGLIRYHNNEIYVYPGVLLSERFTSCSSLEPDIKQVFQGINGGTFVLGYGSPVGNVLKNLVKE